MQRRRQQSSSCSSSRSERCIAHNIIIRSTKYNTTFILIDGTMVNILIYNESSNLKSRQSDRLSFVRCRKKDLLLLRSAVHTILIITTFRIQCLLYIAAMGQNENDSWRSYSFYDAVALLIVLSCFASSSRVNKLKFLYRW